MKVMLTYEIGSVIISCLIILSENPSAALNVVKMTTGLQEDEMLLNSLAKEQFASIVTFTEEGFPTFAPDLFRTCTLLYKSALFHYY